MNRSFLAHIRSLIVIAILTAATCPLFLPATGECLLSKETPIPEDRSEHPSGSSLPFGQARSTAMGKTDSLGDRQQESEASSLPGNSIINRLEPVLIIGSLIWILLLQRQIRKKTAALEKLADDLRQTSEQYRHLFEMTPSSIMLLDKEGRIVDINPYHITHISKGKVTRKEFIGKDAKIRQSIVNAGLSATYEELLKGKPFDLKAVYFPSTTAGTEGYFNVKGTPLTKEGTVIGAIAVHEDITELVQAEKALMESRQRFKEMAELLPSTVCEMDADLKISYINRAGMELFGYTEEEIDAGLFGMDLIHPGERKRALRRLEQRLKGENPPPSEYRVLKRDGTEVPVLLVAVPRFAGDRITGFRASITDISRQKKLQDELLKTRKLESIGILAGGLAHDLNNALAGVMGYISLARINAGPGNKTFKNLHEAEKAALIASDLANRLITFSSGGTPCKRKASIAKVLETSIDMITAGSNTEYTLSIPGKLPEFEFDKNQMKQAFQNVLANARESMPDGGNIHIIAENASSENSGSYVKITIKDQGTGIPEHHIPEHHIDKIFDPYFSTKERGAQKGTGLGLSISYAIIQKHGGEVDVRSLPGKGTTVTIYLPTGEPAYSGDTILNSSSQCRPFE